MRTFHIGIWGDSIGRGVIYDETAQRYRISPENPCAVLQRELGQQVYNYARMGSTARDGLARMTDDRMDRGGVAVIEFGGNDCDMDWKAVSRAPEEDHEAKLPLEAFKSTMQTLVERAQLNAMEPVLVTPPPIDAERYFRWVSRGLNAANILRYLGDVQRIYRWQERYANAVTAVAHRTGTKLIDLRDAFLAETRVSRLLCADGIHPNERGYRLMSDVAREALMG
ncbi:MAG: SGNH/GDSL hydrolase family protein [Clostridia bacterium]|nr:SGNH/GDSL hydrolase family protein [Clostridia bacterium]